MKLRMSGILLNKLKKILNTTFFKRSQIIFLGSLFSQFILFCTSLIITKFYTPNELGLLGSLGALISILAGTLCLRLDIAIIQAPKKESTNIFVKSTLLGGFLCTFAAIILNRFNFKFSENLSSNLILFIFWCWGYCLFFNSKQIPFKHNRLKDASYGGILRNGFTFIYQLILGTFAPSFKALLIGRISGDYVGSLPHLWKHLKSFSTQQIYKNWRPFLNNHKDFIFYTAPHHLCLSLSNNLIIFFIERNFGLTLLGFYTLSQRLIQAPLELIGATLQNVTTQRFGELQDKPIELKNFYLKIIGLSLIISTFLGFIIWFSADYIKIFLGTKWANTSSIIKSLIPFFIGIIFSSPTIFILRFMNKAKIQLILEMIELILKFCLLIFIDWKTSHDMILYYGFLTLFLHFLKTVLVIKFLSKL